VVSGAEEKVLETTAQKREQEGTEQCKCDIEGYSETYGTGAGQKLKAEGAQTFEKMRLASILKAVKRPSRRRL